MSVGSFLSPSLLLSLLSQPSSRRTFTADIGQPHQPLSPTSCASGRGSPSTRRRRVSARRRRAQPGGGKPQESVSFGTQCPSTVKSSTSVASLGGNGRKWGRRRPIGHRQRWSLAPKLRQDGPVLAWFWLSRTSTTPEGGPWGSWTARRQLADNRSQRGWRPEAPETTTEISSRAPHSFCWRGVLPKILVVLPIYW
jgi:hypothetical protein